jgi:hypothetical protein
MTGKLFSPSLRRLRAIVSPPLIVKLAVAGTGNPRSVILSFSVAQQQALRHFLNRYHPQQACRALPTPENAYFSYSTRTKFSTLSGLQSESSGPAAKQIVWRMFHGV